MCRVWTRDSTVILADSSRLETRPFQTRLDSRLEFCRVDSTRVQFLHLSLFFEKKTNKKREKMGHNVNKSSFSLNLAVPDSTRICVRLGWARLNLRHQRLDSTRINFSKTQKRLDSPKSGLGSRHILTDRLSIFRAHNHRISSKCKNLLFKKGEIKEKELIS